jgi:hypothetical protein
VLEGYLLVYLNLDKVIKIIRTEDEPKPKLMKAFGSPTTQAEAILNMRLRSLRKLEEMEIRGEQSRWCVPRKAGCVRSRATRSQATRSNIAKGDRQKFWIHGETTDKLMMFATDGRFFTLDCSKLPGGRGNGEAIRTFIDLPPEADLVAMFVHRDGRKLLLAATSGHGFVTNEDDAVALKRSGKQVMNVSDAGGGCGLRVRRRRFRGRDRREPQTRSLPARRSPGTRPRPRRDPATLQGRQAARRRGVRVEGRLEGPEQPHLDPRRTQRLESGPGTGGETGAERVREEWTVWVRRRSPNASSVRCTRLPTLSMGGLDPPTQPASVCEPNEYLTIIGYGQIQSRTE